MGGLTACGSWGEREGADVICNPHALPVMFCSLPEWLVANLKAAYVGYLTKVINKGCPWVAVSLEGRVGRIIKYLFKVIFRPIFQFTNRLVHWLLEITF